MGQLVKLRAGWKPARGPIVNRPAGFHPAPQKKDMFTRSGYWVFGRLICTSTQRAGQSVPVLYAGASSYAGLDQVDISVPRSLAGTGDVRVYLVADGVASNPAGLKIQ